MQSRVPLGPGKFHVVVLVFHIKGSAFAAVNRDKMFQTRYVKGVPFLKEGIQEGTLLAKNGI